MASVNFIINGPPRPQLRHRTAVRGRHAVMYDDPKSKKDKAGVMTAATNHQPDELLEGPLCVELAFAMPIPKSSKAEPGEPHIKKPDIDNLEKLVLDGITQSGVVWHDDNQVCEVIKRKYYAVEPKTIVRISQIHTTSFIERVLNFFHIGS